MSLRVNSPPKLLAYFRARFYPVADAQELTQDTWLKVVDKFESYDPNKSSFSTWLFAIAHNTHVDQIRRIRSRAVVGADLETLPLPVFPMDDEELDEEIIAKLDECLNALADHEREYIHSHYYLGHSLKEIAAQIGCTDSAMRGKVDRIRDKICKCLRSKGIERL